MEHILKILSFSAFIKKEQSKFLILRLPPKFFDNFFVKDYKQKRLHYFVYIVCVLIHINFEQSIICGCELIRFFVKL